MARKTSKLSPQNGGNYESFDHDALLGLLAEIDNELIIMGSPTIQIVVVGGAAMSWHREMRLTRDVDVISEGMTDALRAAAAIVASRHKLRPDFINDAAKAKTISLTAELELLYEGNRLQVFSPGSRYILAMKLIAGREQDFGDCVCLLKGSDIEDVDTVLDLVEEALPFSMSRTLKIEYFTRMVFDAAKGETQIVSHDSGQQKQTHVSARICGAMTTRKKICKNPRPLRWRQMRCWASTLTVCLNDCRFSQKYSFTSQHAESLFVSAPIRYHHIIIKSMSHKARSF